MKTTIEVNTWTRAHQSEVWRLLADVSSWWFWGPWDDTALLREGLTDRDGVGAIRKLRKGRRVVLEEVVAFEPDRRFAYVLRSGLALRNYRAEVLLEPTGEGTTITWTARFDRTPTSTMMKPFVAWLLRDVAERLARAATERSMRHVA